MTFFKSLASFLFILHSGNVKYKVKIFSTCGYYTSEGGGGVKNKISSPFTISNLGFRTFFVWLEIHPHPIYKYWIQHSLFFWQCVRRNETSFEQISVFVFFFICLGRDRKGLNKVDDPPLGFEVEQVSNLVSHPKTCHNICVQECGCRHSTIYQHTASHDSWISPLSSERKYIYHLAY